MPFLGHRIHILNPILKKERKSKDSINKPEVKAPKYVIALTGEICETEEELKRKEKIYGEKIWSCRCTGKLNLSYKHAINSEQATHKLVKKSVPRCFEKSILEVVHHSVDSLDVLVRKVWMLLHTELCLNEPITLKVSGTLKERITGVIIKVDKPAEESPVKANGTTSPSSSDKENTAIKKSQGQPQKKNYFYSVKLINEDKIVSRIPVSAIVRDFRAPNKDHIRLFIRAHAMRYGVNMTGPWVVDDDYSRKYKLKSKNSKFEVDKKQLKKLSIQNEIEAYTRQLKKDSPGSELGSSGSGGGGKKGKRILVLRGEIADEARKVLVYTDSDDEDVPLMIIKKKQESAAFATPVGKGKKLKQTTLFDLGSANKSSSSKSASSIKSMFASASRMLPSIATRLIKMVKEKKQEAVIAQMVTRCAQMLTDAQIQNIPAEIRDRIREKKNKIEDKKKLNAMTPVQREELMKERRQEERMKRLAVMKEKNRRFEDTELSCSPLPTASPVIFGDKVGLTAPQIGSVLSLAEMFRCFQGLLLPPEAEEMWRNWEKGATELRNVYGDTVVHAERLCEALGAESDGFLYLGHVLTCLLQTLLQDDAMNGRRELGSKLSEIPVTPYTASEMLRLVLSPQVRPVSARNRKLPSTNGLASGPVKEPEAGDEAEDTSDSEDDVEVASSERLRLCALLEETEFHELSVGDKLQLLELVQQSLLDMEMLDEHMDSVQKKLTDAWKKRFAELKRKNDRIREEKARRKAEAVSTPAKKEAVCSAKKADKKAEEEPKSQDLASVVKRRRQMAAQAAQEREERDREERERRAIEAVQLVEDRTLQAVAKELDQVTQEARAVIRLTPLGTDRLHNRYWRFHAAPPGIYVERSWSAKEGDVAALMALGKSPKKTPNDSETTIPSTRERPCWMVYDSEAQLDALAEALNPKGCRESLLKEELAKVIAEEKARIRAFNLAKQKRSEVSSDKASKGAEDPLIQGFKTELNETNQRVVNGSLSVSPDITTWQSRLVTAKSRSQLARCLTDVQTNILERFLCGPFTARKSSSHPATVENDAPIASLTESPWVAQWKEAVVQAKTQSRLNLLQGYLDSCIRWEKSTEDAKCRICRQKSNELLLCDGCNQTFHIYCLRPPLAEVPRGDWFCTSCKPPERRPRKDDLDQRRRYREEASGSEADSNYDSNEEQNAAEVSQNSVSCCVCQEDDGELICCSSCRTTFHLLCHEPPLRLMPRGDGWICSNCRRSSQKSGTTPKRTSRSNPVKRTPASGRKAKAKATPKGRYTEESTEQESDEEATPGPAPRRNGRPANKRKKRASRKKDSEEEETSSEEEPPVKARKSNNSKKRARVLSSEEEVSEQEEQEVVEPAKKRVKRASTPLAPSTGMTAQQARSCKTILDNLYRHRCAWPFVDPVNKDEVPDYYDIIKAPMDLSTMKTKLKAGGYESMESLVEDVGQMMTNAEVYNQPSTDVYVTSQRMEDYFLTQLARLAPNINYNRRLPSS